MLALLFEMLPKTGHMDHYFRHVNMLKPVLARHTGMLWLDRFRSLSRENAILSHQLWEDEAAIVRWREDEQHKGTQAAGRNKHFDDYRIRIIDIFARVEQGKPVREYALGKDAMGDFVVVGHSQGKVLDGVSEGFSSFNIDGAHAGVAVRGDEAEARKLLSDMAVQDAMTWGFAGRVTRDYGMYDRVQAPQDYPPVIRP